MQAVTQTPLTREQILAIDEHEPPVLLADGKLGMLCVFPGTQDTIGVQVYGEENHRWIPLGELFGTKRGALKQLGAPAMPPASAQGDMVQMLLAMKWASLGGPLDDEWL